MVSEEDQVIINTVFNWKIWLIKKWSNLFLDLDLSEVVTMEVMAPILANKSIQEKLIQYLPDSEVLPKTEHELRTTLTTPQFKKVTLRKKKKTNVTLKVFFLNFILGHELV